MINNNKNNNTNTIDVHGTWIAIHKEMLNRYKINEKDVNFANKLSQSIKKIYTEIHDIQNNSNDNKNETGVYGSLINIVKKPYEKDGNYKGFNYLTSGFVLNKDVKGIDNEFELEMAALLDTALTGNYTNIDNSKKLISAQQSFKTYAPGKNLQELLDEAQGHLKAISNFTVDAISSELVNSWLNNAKAKEKITVKKTGLISGGKTDIRISCSTINVNVELPEGLSMLRATLNSYGKKNVTFSLKSYEKNTIHFGHSNFFNSLYLPLRTLKSIPTRNIRRFLYETLTDWKIDPNFPIIEHINHIRSIYDMTGLGQYAKKNISLEAQFLIVSLSKTNFSVIPMSVLANEILNEHNNDSIVFATEKTITDYINDEKGKKIVVKK